MTWQHSGKKEENFFISFTLLPLGAAHVLEGACGKFYYDYIITGIKLTFTMGCAKFQIIH